MKILKIVMLFIFGLGALILIGALFVDGNYAVERQVVVNKSKPDVFEYLKYLKNQEEFSVWTMMDPQMETYYDGTDATIGFVAGWKSTNSEVGSGEQEILGITEGERIDLALRFFEPFEANDKAYFATEALGETETLVKWGFNGKMNYPMNLLLLFMDMEEMLGGQLEKGLDNLKVNLEKR
jgi:hypothetical protein